MRLGCLDRGVEVLRLGLGLGLFGIMVHPGCIQICMECCDPFPPKYMPKIKEYEQQLKQHLLQLHQLHIIHHDIKMENICFSLAFSSLVFIDFGMSRIVKEEFGFKSLTKYRGTLSHCGDEMTNLFEKNTSDIHYVDLYYNDMIGLKKTFENLRLDQFKHDIALISRLRKEKDKITISIKSFYQIYVVKHHIFQAQYNFQTIGKLDYLQLRSLFEFIPSLPFSPDINRLYRYIQQLINKINANFEEYNQFSLRKQSNYSIKDIEEEYPLHKLKAQTLKDLRKVSTRNITDYFLNGPARFEQLLQFLKTPEAAAYISLENYLCLLAKAIQINASTVKFSQLNEVCLVAQRRSEQFYAMRFDSKYSHEEESCFFLASEFLFKTAFKHELKGKYFNVYCSIINNILAFKMLSNQQLLQYYDILLRLPIPFENKLLAILKFHTGFVWMYINASSLDSYQVLQEEIQKKCNSYLSSSPAITLSEAHLLSMVISKDLDFKKGKLYEDQKILSQNTKLQLRMWVVNKGVLKQRVNANTDDEINNISSELSFQKTTVIEYYHFFFMVFFYLREDWKRLDGLIHNYRSVFRGRLNNIFVSSLQNAKMLRSEAYRNMGDRIPVFQTLLSCNHPLTNLVIHNQLDFFIRMNWLRFKLCRKELKAQILRMIMVSYEKVAKSDKNKPLKEQFRSLSRLTLKQTEIQQRYFYEMLEKMKDIRPEKGKQKFFELRKMLHTSNVQGGKFQQQSMLNSILTVIALLIKKKDIEKALEMGKFLYRITHFTWNQQINKTNVLKFIFLYIIQENDSRNYTNYREANRHLYFDYAKLLRDEDKEELYIVNFSVFADTIALMYRYRFDELSVLLNCISKKVMAFSCKRSSQRYSAASQLAFYRIKRQPRYEQNILNLQKQLSLTENPYNVLPLQQIQMLKHKKYLTQSNFIKNFATLRFINIFAKEIVLRKLYPYFLFFKSKKLAPRRSMRLIVKAVSYNFFILSGNQLMKLLIPPNSMHLLKISENTKKKDSIERVLKRYNQVIQWRDKVNVVKLKISYRFLDFYV